MVMVVGVASHLGFKTIGDTEKTGNLLKENVEALTTNIEVGELPEACRKGCIFSIYYNCLLYTNIGTITCVNSIPWRSL